MRKNGKKLVDAVWDVWDSYSDLSTKFGASERLSDVLKAHRKGMYRKLHRLERVALEVADSK